MTGVNCGFLVHDLSNSLCSRCGFPIKKHELPQKKKIMNSIEKDIPSYEELVLELARQVKFNEVDEYSNFEDISEEVCSQKADNENISFEDIPEEDTIKKLGRKKFWNLTLLKPFVDILKYKT